MKTPIKIVVFGSLPSGFGGMETVFIEFSHYFKQNADYQIDFCMYELNPGQNDYTWLQSLPHQLYQPHTQLRWLQKVKTRRFFKQYLKQQQPDLVIAYDALSVFLAKKSIASLKGNITLYSWIHFSLTRFKPKYQNYILLADYHLAICDQIKEQFINMGASKLQCHVIYNPIIIPEYIIPPPKDDCIKLLYVGRIQYSDQKNIQECFCALRKLSVPFQLDIVGNGNENDIEKLNALAIELSIDDKIFWHGWQKNPWVYVRNKIKHVSALLLTSSSEGFPMTLCEALARGIFCISANCETGPADVINKTNGLLYCSGNEDELAACIHKFTDSNDKINPINIKKSIHYLSAENYFNRLIAIFSVIKK